MTTSPSNQLTCRNDEDNNETAELVANNAIHPITGELVELDRPLAYLGCVISEVQEMEGELRAFKAAVRAEILQRMDRAAKWTLEDDGVKVSSSSPNQVDYDPVQLASALTTLVSSGAIDEEAAHACIEMMPQVKKSGINALLKLGGEIAEAVQACGTPSTRPRTVKVEVR